MTARFHNPVDTRFGWGSLQELAAITEHQTVALVTFPEARGLGLVDRIQDLLGDRLVYVIEDVQPNPDVAQLRDTYERFWQEAGECHAVIAVGGGSAIDTAKALIVGTESGRFDELLALLATRQTLCPGAQQNTDCGAHHGGHRQRSHALGDDLGLRQPQEILAAPGLHLAQGRHRRPGADADGAGRRHRFHRAWMPCPMPWSRSGTSMPTRFRTPSPSPPSRTSWNACRCCGVTCPTRNCVRAWHWPPSRPAWRSPTPRPHWPTPFPMR